MVEVNDNFKAYGVGKHRHMAELDTYFSKASGQDVAVSFTPHLVPMNRGIYATIYAQMADGVSPKKVREVWQNVYGDEAFIHLLPEGAVPSIRDVNGTNEVHLSVTENRSKTGVVMISAIDNLIKGASGQAIQNFNLVFGLSESTGLDQPALFP